MKKRLFYILLFSILTLSGFAQKDTLIPLSKLKNETLYYLDWNRGGRLFDPDFINQNINSKILNDYKLKYPERVDTNLYIDLIPENELKNINFKIINVKDLDTLNRNSIYRLRIIGPYPDSVAFSKLYFPNLQELHVWKNGAFPKDISIYKKLQILDVDQLYGEIFFVYSAPLKITLLDTMGYKIPFVFPEEIYRLSHLKVLYFDTESETFITLSEKISSLKELEASYVHDYHNQLYIPISLLQYHNFNIKQIIGFGETANGYWKRNPRRKIDEVSVFNARSTKYKTHRTFLKTCNYSKKYNNGNLMIQGRFEKRKPVGKWTMYYEDGHICQERFYKDGVEDSVWTFWSETDTTKPDNYSYNTDTIRYKIYFTQGKIDSLVNFYSYKNEFFKEQVISNFSDYYNRTEENYSDNNKIYEKLIYKNGVAVFKEKFHKDDFTDYTNITNFYKQNETYSIELLTQKNSIEKTIIEIYDSLSVLEQKQIKYVFASIGIRNEMLADSIITKVFDGNNNLIRKEDSYFGKYPDRTQRIITKEYDTSGIMIYQKQGEDYSYRNIQFEEFFVPEYIKIEYAQSYFDRERSLIHRYYYNKSGELIKQDAINPIDYNTLHYRNITLPTEHNK